MLSSRAMSSSKDASAESLPLCASGGKLHDGSASSGRPIAAQGSLQQHAAQLARQAADGVWTLLAPLAPVAVLCVGILVSSLEAGPGRPVDREHCDCSCWDGRFKGRHGLSTHGAQYKSVYFNIEPATALLVAWCCVWLHLLGRTMQRLALLAAARRLSGAALLAALLQFYPMFYASWVVFNYINDRFYLMLPSQLFFQATELIPCFFIYNLLDSATHKQLQPLVCVLGLAVACAHILLALKERVLWGLFLSDVHTVNGRDVMLIAGDVGCLVLFGRLLNALQLPRREAAALVPVGVGSCVALVLIYVAGFGYSYS